MQPIGTPDNKPANTAIVIPAFNEGEIIERVIADIRTYCDYPLIVVDDASTDDTCEAARRAGACVLTLGTQLGAWGATQTGLRYALRQGYQFVVSMDADGQHEPRALSALLEPVHAGETDVAIGACTQRGSLLRHVAWRLIKQASGLDIEDITSGYRAYNRRAVERLANWRATLLDYQDIGVLLLLQSSGLRIADIQVPMQTRSNGKSRIFHSWVIAFYYVSYSLLLGFSKRGITRDARPGESLN